MATRQTNLTTLQHPIQVVARRTGLSADVIRVWERRYDAVKPTRASNSRRLYTDDDVERLMLLRHATSAGRRIGEVANLTIKQLRNLVDTDETAVARIPISKIEQRPSTGSVMEHFDDCLDAIIRLHSEDLHRALNDASKSLGILFLLEDLLRPLLSHIKDECRRGGLREAHYSMTLHTLHGFLASLVMSEPLIETDHKLVCASPSGQASDLAALCLAVAAKSHGWQVIFLGEAIAVEEMIFAQQQTDAQLVAIGITRPTDDPLLANQLRRLRTELNEHIEIAVTGSGAAAYFDILQEIQASYIQTLSKLLPLLDRISQYTRVKR